MNEVRDGAARQTASAVDARALSGLAHGLRNTAASFRFGLELLRGCMASAPPNCSQEAGRYIDLLTDELTTFERTLGSLDRLRRLPVPAPERVAMRRVLEDAVRLAAPALGEGPTAAGVVIEHEGPEEAIVDAGLLAAAIAEVVRNAQQAVAATGGRIVVRCEPCGADHLVIEVEDNGPGMGAFALERCTDAFFTTKRGHAGLGLTEARIIAERHGGKLSVTSELAGGTVVSLAIPTGAVARSA